MSALNEVPQQSSQDAVDNARLERLLRENTELTKSMHRILVGEPQYGRKGLVETVDRHEKLIVKGGASFCTLLTIWEVFKVIHPFK